MPERPAVGSIPCKQPLIYCYDGSFDGLLCCVFESYNSREIPSDILPDTSELPFLLPVKSIATIPGRARRVRRSIPQKIGTDAMDFVRRAFLTCHAQKELLILKFLRLGYEKGPVVMRMLTDDTVHALNEAILHLEHEAHLLTGFVRFSDASGVLVSTIEPKNTVLPIIAPHFCARYPNERFVLYDKTHSMALLHQNGAWEIADVDAFSMPEPDAEERKYRALWRLFYDTIEVEGRHNPRCRMGHMPKRYWRCMTEFMANPAPKEEAPTEAKTGLLTSPSLLPSPRTETNE